jgi:hypothetical protein
MNFLINRFKPLLLSICLLAAISTAGFAQSGTRMGRADEKRQTLSSQPQPPSEPAARANAGFTLEDGAIVKLKLMRDLLSSKLQDKEAVDFEVIEDVKVEGIVVIPRGAKAEGTVTDIQAARRMGRSGRIGVRLDWALTGAGERIPLRAVGVRPSGESAEKPLNDTAATAIILFPAAPFILMKKGKDVTIPEGTLATSFVDGDHPLDREAFVRPSERRP